MLLGTFAQVYSSSRVLASSSCISPWKVTINMKGLRYRLLPAVAFTEAADRIPTASVNGLTFQHLLVEVIYIIIVSLHSFSHKHA